MKPKKWIILFLTLYYLLASVLITDFGLIYIIIAILFFILYIIYEGINISFFLNTSLFDLFLLFLFSYTILILIDIRYWAAEYDKFDIAAYYLFFFIIPLIFAILTFESSKFERYLTESIYIFFLITSILILVNANINGIDWNESILIKNSKFHKNGIACIYELLMVFIYFSLNNKTFLKYTSLALGFICLIAIGSKTAIGLVAIVIIISKIPIKIIICGVIIISVSIIWLIINSDIFIQDFFYTSFTRILIWENVIEDISKSNVSIIFGNGPETFTSSVKEGDSFGMNHPHNIVLYLLQVYGIVGLVIFSIYYYKVFKIIRIKSSPYFFPFTIYILHSMFDVGWTKSTGFFASLFLGMAIGFSYKKKIQIEKENSFSQ